MIEFNGRIAVFGGRDITESIYNDTVEIGRQMAKENWLVFCGGGEGVMEAIAKGVSEENGVCIGILKDKDFVVREAANFDQALLELDKKLPDVAIIDVKLDKGDKKDGIDLLKKIKSLIDNFYNH